MKDYEIGDTIRFGNVLLKVEPSKFMNCDGCFFQGCNCGNVRLAHNIGHCTETHREDKTSVIFVKQKTQEKMKEHKVGERFIMPAMPAVTLEVVASILCDGCYFLDGDDCRASKVEFCSKTRREDATSVIFKAVPPTIEDAANSMVAAAVGNVDFAYIIAHRTIEGEISIKTIGKPENISMLKERLLKILEEGK